MSDGGTESDTPQPGRTRALSIAAAILSVLVLALVFESFCQVYARWVIFPRLEAREESPRFYYRASENRILGYELEPERATRGGARASCSRWPATHGPRTLSLGS